MVMGAPQAGSLGLNLDQSQQGDICREAADWANAQDPIHPQDNLPHMDFDKSRTSSYRKDKENT